MPLALEWGTFIFIVIRKRNLYYVCLMSIFILRINIMETKVKHCANNEVLFFYHPMKQKQFNKEKEISRYGKIEISKGK